MQPFELDSRVSFRFARLELGRTQRCFVLSWQKVRDGKVDADVGQLRARCGGVSGSDVRREREEKEQQGGEKEKAEVRKDVRSQLWLA